jgi:DNA-binding LacI/PurR family transcriptional regulator
MVTLKEIAKRAGVSPSTVSKALRGCDDLNRETADKIAALALEMGYSLSKKHERERLSPGRRPCVGIICPEVISSYYSRIVSTLSELFRDKNIDTFLVISDFSPEREAALLERMVAMKMAAVICITEQEQLSPLIRRHGAFSGIPILQIAMNQQPVGHDNICIDEKAGVFMIINHLVSLGHKKIAFFGEQFSERRKRYFTMAMEEYGLDSSQVFITRVRHWQAGYELAGEALAAKKRFTALVAEYDDIAVGAMRRFGELGLLVPGDCSVAGFDDVRYCRYLPVSLTTVETHVEEMCGIAFDALYRKIAEPSYRVCQNISIIPDLVCRESTASPARQR